MKLAKLIAITLFALFFNQAKSQCANSIKVSTSFTDTLVFQIYTSTPNDTTTLTIYNRWGQVVKRVLYDSVMQPGYHTVIYVADSGLQAGTYVYTFSSHCLHHNGYITHVSSVSGIKEFSFTNAIYLYPNPSNGFANVQSQNELGTIKIYNALGAIVYEVSTKENTLHIDINQQGSGVYFVQVQNQYIKLIKQ